MTLSNSQSREINTALEEFENISYNHKSITSSLETQTKIVTNTTEQLIYAYTVYGLEHGLNA
jgi:hypothetical protein